jgi:hypothetical protein
MWERIIEIRDFIVFVWAITRPGYWDGVTAPLYLPPDYPSLWE